MYLLISFSPSYCSITSVFCLQSRLEQYREEQKKGKELNGDQLAAVSKYDEVIQTLEFAKDLSKQFNILAVDTGKQLKKQQRKEQAERLQQEQNRIKEILIVQVSIVG